MGHAPSQPASQPVPHAPEVAEEEVLDALAACELAHGLLPQPLQLQGGRGTGVGDDDHVKLVAFFSAIVHLPL